MPSEKICTTASAGNGEKTKAGAIDRACEFTKQMVPNLEHALDHPDMTEELAKILSTNNVQLDYRIETDIHINGDRDD